MSLEVCGRLCDCVTPRLATGRDPVVGQQEGGRLGLHRGAVIGMQRQLPWQRIVLNPGLVEQQPEQRGAIWAAAVALPAVPLRWRVKG